MKLLIVSQYYWPEFFLINPLSQKLLNLGHEITIATGKPNYPHGVIYSGYSSAGLKTEFYNGIKIVRVPLRPRKKGAINLAINYLSFVYFGLRHFPTLLKGESFDYILVFGMSPITAAIPAIFLKRKLNTRLAIWVQDLWPESLAATGYIKNKHALKLVGVLVKWIYSKADILLAQSRAFVQAISEYASTDKIIYYPNSIDASNQPSPDTQIDLPVDITSQLRKQFSIVFAGNMGKAQSIDTIIDAAELLLDCDCKIFFVGDGSLKSWAESEVMNRNLLNVGFLGRFENQSMPLIYENTDLLLVTLNKSPIFSLTIPSKLQAYLAAGKPIVASLNGEAADVINESGAGISCAAEDPQQLAAAIRQMYLMSTEERRELGIAGKEYFLENFDMDKLAIKLIDILADNKGDR